MKIETSEFICTIGCVGIIPLVLTIPTFNAQTYGTGAMAHTLYSFLMNAIILFLLFHLYFQFSNQDIIDISEYVGGSFLKILTTVLASVYLITSAVLVLVEFNENIRNILFQNAPSDYIYLIFLVGLVIGVFHGLKGVFRAATIFAPLILMSLIFMFLSLYQDIDITNFTPIFGNDMFLFWKDALKIEFFEGMLLILLLGNTLKNPKKAAIWSYLFIAFIILLITVLLYGIIPYPSITENYFPFFELSRLMSFGRFWQRVESLYTFIWLIAVYIYISIGTSYTVFLLSKVCHLNFGYRIAPLISLLVISLARFFVSYPDIIHTRKFLTNYITPYVALGYPLVILLLATIKKRSQIHETNS